MQVKGGVRLRVREEPTTEAAIVRKIEPGKRVYVSEERDGWCKVSGGWCMSEYLE